MLFASCRVNHAASAPTWSNYSTLLFKEIRNVLISLLFFWALFNGDSNTCNITTKTGMQKKSVLIHQMKRRMEITLFMDVFVERSAD